MTNLTIDADRHAEAGTKLEQAIAVAELMASADDTADAQALRVSAGLLATILRDADAALQDTRLAREG